METGQRALTVKVEEESLKYIQSFPGGKVNILGGHSIDHSKKKCLYENVFYSERYPIFGDQYFEFGAQYFSSLPQ
jgi:hypothetical protein